MLEINEISLEMLSSKEKLDNNTLRRCNRNGLMNLEDILQYYLNNGNFRKLKLRNEYTNKKLIAICEKYSYCPLNLYFIIENQVESNSEVITKEIPNLSLNELAHAEGLSARAITCCLNYKLTNLERILHFYYLDKECFRQLRNCGKNTENELIQICEKYSDFAIKTVNPLFQEIESKSEGITKEIQNFYLNELTHIDGLSARSITICLNYGLTNLERILYFYFVEKESFLSLRNCGQKSNLELINFCNYYKNYSIVQKTLEIPRLQRKRNCGESNKNFKKSKQSYWYMRLDHTQ